MLKLDPDDDDEDTTAPNRTGTNVNSTTGTTEKELDKTSDPNKLIATYTSTVISNDVASHDGQTNLTNNISKVRILLSSINYNE